MKKRILALLLALCMVFVLCACGGGDSEKDDDKGSSINKGGSSYNAGNYDDDDDVGYNGGSSVATDTSEAVQQTKDYLNAYLSGDAEGMFDAANWSYWYSACVENGTMSKSNIADKKTDQIAYYQEGINSIGEMYGGGWYYSFEITDIREVSQYSVEDWNETIYDMCGYNCTASCVIEFTFTIEGDNGAADTYEASAQWFYVGGVWMLPFDY